MAVDGEAHLAGCVCDASAARPRNKRHVCSQPSGEGATEQAVGRAWLHERHETTQDRQGLARLHHIAILKPRCDSPTPRAQRLAR
jgi:hypothetical protein